MPHREDSQDQPARKPSNWWAFEREPWRRVSAEIMAEEKAGADRERTDRALRSAFAFAGAALAMANAPSLPCWGPGMMAEAAEIRTHPQSMPADDQRDSPGVEPAPSGKPGRGNSIASAAVLQEVPDEES